jgi:sortase (surface protein transpeptidase)
MVPDKRGELQWDTDSLFANRKRDDLVGQVAVSLNPGEGGNIILVGHNTNVGIDWAGVFYNLASLQPGTEIILSTEDGGEYHYIVQLVKKVPWKRQSEAELLKHQRFLFPTESEQLTLVTCGGVFTTQYSARIYVVAVPAIP